MTKKNTTTKTSKDAKADLAKRQIHLLSLALIATVIFSMTITLIAVRKYKSVSDDLELVTSGFRLKTWQIGDVIEAPEFRLVVKGVDVDSVGIPNYLPVPEGHKYVAVDIILTNKTADERIFIPLNTTYLRDGEGKRYELTLAPNVETTAAGRIASGDKVSGQIGFLVPEDVQDMKFYFEPFGAASDTVVVSIVDKNTE